MLKETGTCLELLSTVVRPLANAHKVLMPESSLDKGTVFNVVLTLKRGSMALNIPFLRLVLSYARSA